MGVEMWLGGTDSLVELDAAHDAAWRAVDPDLLSLCRDRVAVLLRHDIASDAPPPREPDDRERAALEFTEQYVVDVTAVTDRQTEALRQHLGDQGLVDFVNALIVIEQRMTLELGLSAVLGERGAA